MIYKPVKQFSLIFATSILVVFLVSGFAYYFHHIKPHRKILFDREVNKVELQKMLLQHMIKSIISDINIIAADIDHKLNTLTGQSARKEATENFLSLSRYKGIYDQIRILDKTGMEILRVNLEHESPILVPNDQLQFKGDRYYFKDVIKLNRGEVFISPFDLNIEHGVIERPLKPTIRLAIPLWDRQGEKKGVLVLNYLGSNLIHTLEQTFYQSSGIFLMTNSHGFWIKAENPSEEWGFMFEDGKRKKIQDRYPQVWSHINQANSGQVINSHGLFTYTKVFPLDTSIHSSTGSPEAHGDSLSEISSANYFWVILSHIPSNILKEEDNQFILNLVLGDLSFLLVFGFLSWGIVSANAQKKAAEKALRHSHQKLEQTVELRTKELSETNLALENKIQENEKIEAQRKKLEGQLRQSQKMEAIGTLASGIAHDFNNILTPIIGYSEIIHEKLDPKDPIQADVNQIFIAGTRAKDLVQQILLFSRRNKESAEPQPLKIQTILEECIKLLRASLPPNIEIQQDISPECSEIMADPVQIHQIVMNLCTNAYHAMEETGGFLRIQLSQVEILPEDIHLRLQSGDYARLIISDSGSGMTLEVQDKIFDPYFTTKPEGKGTGLGLSIIHRIIQSLNGHITVYSEPGKGTSFNIYVPLLSEKEAAKAEPKRELHLFTGNERILIVDDEPSILQLEKRFLQNLGYRVTDTTESRKAYEIFKKNPDSYDLIITDMAMPQMSGRELIQKVLIIRPEMKTILCTGYSDISTSETSKQIPATGFFSKPLSMKSFSMVVRDVLDQAHA